MIVKRDERWVVPPPKEGPWRLPDHLDLPPAPPRTDGAPPWCFPDHTMLPDKDGQPVRNTLEPVQSAFLTQCIRPWLQQLHPDNDYLIGQDLGIYWKLLTPPETLRGAIAPDWFYVPNVAPLVDELMRRSYVLWQEEEPPVIVIEYVSGDGSEERDRTPDVGKMAIYERHVRAAHYAIFNPFAPGLEVFRLSAKGRYEPLPGNAHGRFPIAAMRAELGLWQGHFQDETHVWLRWWDDQGNLLPSLEDIVAAQHDRAEQERQRAEQERQRADRLAERLRALGVSPEELL